MYLCLSLSVLSMFISCYSSFCGGPQGFHKGVQQKNWMSQNSRVCSCSFQNQVCPQGFGFSFWKEGCLERIGEVAARTKQLTTDHFVDCEPQSVALWFPVVFASCRPFATVDGGECWPSQRLLSAPPSFGKPITTISLEREQQLTEKSICHHLQNHRITLLAQNHQNPRLIPKASGDQRFQRQVGPKEAAGDLCPSHQVLLASIR